jgi:hypothetical protein
MATNITTVMDDIGTALATITGLRVYDFPPKSAQPPFAFVDMPDTIEYDCTYQRGTDRCKLNVVVAVADVVDRSVRDQIAAYAAGSGVQSIKAVLDAASIGQTRRVVSADFRPIVVGGGMYFGAVFELDIVF